jgi:hypothetical protein
MLISPLPGAGTGGGFVIPLYPGPTFSFVDPDLMYGVLKGAPLTIANFCTLLKAMPESRVTL